jgi:hypothetical protein
VIAPADPRLMADDAARAYRRRGFQVHTSPFRYSFPVVNVTRPGGLDEDQGVQLETDRDSVFAWLAIMASFRDEDHPGALESYFGGWSLQLTDLSSGYRLVGPDRILPHQALVGYADAPFVLGFPYILPPGANLLAVVRGSGEVGPVRLTLEGIKLFTTPYTRSVILPDVPEAA